MDRLRQLLKVTAIRLTLAYTLLFGVLALGLVFYVSYNTGQLIIGQIRAAADEEVDELSEVYRRGGARSLIRSIDRRSRNPGAYLYLVSDQSGRIITGNVKNVDPNLLKQGGWSATPFPYEPIEGLSGGTHRAIAQVFNLQGGLRLLVGRDIGDASNFRSVIGRAFTIGLAVMLLAGLVLWFVIGRRALQRIDRVSRSSARILAGDLSERLPVSGAEDEFDRLSGNLNQMIARVETLNAGVRNMSDSIAHDLKTPLTRLRNRAEAALSAKRMSKEKREETLNEIITDADGLIKTFDALLMISQVSAGARNAQLKPLDLASIVRDVYELVEPSADETGMDVSITIEDIPEVLGNRELIAQALINLVDNAVKYGANAGRKEIQLSLKQDQGRAVVKVADSGPGIDEADLERVKERFVRLDASRSTPGTGLGLAQVDAVATLHNGELELADNSPGLVAKLILPLSSSGR